MKYLVCVMLFLLYACESTIVTEDTKKIKKNKNIQMKVKTEPSVKIKK